MAWRVFSSIAALANCDNWFNHTNILKRRLQEHAYVYRSYDQMSKDVRDLAEKYPNLLKLYVGEKEFKSDIHQSAHTMGNDCGTGPCETLIVEIGNQEKMTAHTPEIFISGAVHGNERVGPTVVFYMIELMASRYASGSSTDIDKSLRYLMDNRKFIVMPFTNAEGYFRHRREERGIDVNRDFPYMRAPNQCMQTITARIVNELFRRHLFRLAVTFHGGTKSISYEWGTPNHKTMQYVFQIDLDFVRSFHSFGSCELYLGLENRQ